MREVALVARRTVIGASFLLAAISAVGAQAPVPVSEGGGVFALIDDHAAMMLLIDPDSGVILGANKSAQAFYGYQALVGMKIQDINVLSPEEIAWLEHGDDGRDRDGRDRLTGTPF